MGTSKDVEKKIIWELTDLLRKNADSILTGKTKLCLTTSSLTILAANFQRVSQLVAEERNVQTVPRRHNILNRTVADQELWKDNVSTLHDFLHKTVSLKIIHVSYTIKSPVQIARFSSLQVLELKKVPVHMIEGLSKLRGQLREIVISRCVQKLQHVLEICGGDRSSGLIWQNLKSAYVSFNYLQELDNSLRFAPFLEVLDVSHNNISRTEDYLQNLTDILRINLGYNMLGAVPQFSYSNKGKLRTLVLRNNNLDNLKGIQELTALQELDLTDNCLSEHSCLATLSHLNRLSVLCLIGNPLSYKSDHRTITLGYLSPLAGMGAFLLDGRRLSAHEITILKETSHKTSRDQTDSYNMLGVSDSESTGFDLTDGEASDSRNNSLVVPSGSHSRKKKRGHRRVLSKERIPKIANIEDSMEAQSLPVSKNGSPTGSYVEDPDDVAAVEKEKQRVELMREHFKDDWLKALYADHKEHYQEQITETQSATGDGGQRTITAEITPGVGDVKVLPNDNDRILMTDDKPQKPGAIPPPLPSSDCTTDIYVSTELSPTSPTSPRAGGTSTETGAGYIKGAEWTRATDQLYYGEESDPFIVMLPSEDMRQIFISVNDRYILEKDLHGTCREMVDLKCLLSIAHSEEMLSGKDIVWGVMFPVVTLKFDYVRRDMKSRRYAMEDATFAKQLAGLLQRHVTAREQLTRALQQVECLKCKHEFVKPRYNQSEPLRCPQCGSKMVFDVTSQQSAPDHTTIHTDVGKEKKEVEVLRKSSSPKSSPKLQRSSALRRKDKAETPSEVTQRSSPGSFLRWDKGRRTSEGFIVGDSLRETVDSMIPELGRGQDAPPRAEEDSDDATVDSKQSKSQTAEVVLRDGNIQRTASTDQIRRTIHTHGMVQHRSWSDIPKSLDRATGGMVQNLSCSDIQKLSASSAMRSSVSSVESDITVLATNSSRGSITAISESSRELLVNSGNVNAGSTLDNSDKTGLDSDSGTCETGRAPGDVTDGVCVSRVRDSPGHTTPAGSPLSSSVCSSMVTSVYENTLAGAGDNTDHDDGSRVTDNDTASEDSLTFRNKYSDTNLQSDSQKKQTGDFQSSDLLSGITIHVNGDTDISTNGEISVYRSAESTLAKVEMDNDSTGNVINDVSMPSIYDSITSANFQDRTTVSQIESNSRDASPSIYDVNTDLSNQSTENHSRNGVSTDSLLDVSPLRRGRRSNRSFKNRNIKIYGSDDQMEESSQTNTDLETHISGHNGGTSNIETAHSSFPPDLSPIKRVSTNRPDHAHRSAMFIDSELHNDNNSLDLSHTSDLSVDRNDDTDVNESVGNVSHSTADMQLPWESEESVSKEESLSHEEFVNIDHRLQLYLELKVFRAVEVCQCAIQSSIVQYMNLEPTDSFLVVSTTRILLFSIHGNPDSDSSSDWLKCYEDQPITELQFVDIGLGYQSLRLEFDTECSSYTLVIADEGRCKRILTLLTEILQSVSLSGHSKLEGISKSVPGTMVNLELEVLLEAGDQEPQEFVRYLMATVTDAEGDNSTLLGVVVTATDVVLVEENHQWPLPRLQAPLGDLKGKQFTIEQREKINNIETLEFNEYNPCELRISFFNEGSDEKVVWLLTMVSTHGVKSLVDAIRTPWEEEFGVSLDITPISFSD